MVDNECQLYFSSPTDGYKENYGMNIIHFQSLTDNMYQNININYCLCDGDVSANNVQSLMFSTDDECLFYDDRKINWCW